MLGGHIIELYILLVAHAMRKDKNLVPNLLAQMNLEHLDYFLNAWLANFPETVVKTIRVL